MTSNNEHAIELLGVEKCFENISKTKSYALSDITFNVLEGEFIAIVGPSGSGKSTLLRIISDLEDVSNGSIKYLQSSNAKIGFVFQDNTIFPWFTVQRNITYSLEILGVSLADRVQKAKEYATLVGLDPDIYLSKYPKELSGGEKRRVAIAMSLVHDANILLLDEPTSSLDDMNKWNFQEIIQNLWIEKKFTCIIVTHDIEEAIFLGSRVLILKKGILENVVHVDFAYPRTKLNRISSEFQLLRNHISNLL